MPGKFSSRLGAYVEIAVVSIVWLAAALASMWFFVERVLTTKDPWAVGLGLAVVFVLPYLVVAAVVWDVNLGVLGAKAEKTTVGDKTPSRRDNIEVLG
jgi:hypothetical protein